MYLLCQRSRKRRKLRKKPRPPLVLLQWHHLQSTRPAQGNTVRLSSLLVINYYLVLHDVWMFPKFKKSLQVFGKLKINWLIVLCLCSCNHSGWSDTAGRPWRRGLARGSGSDSSQPRHTPAWGHYPAVRPPAWRPWPTATANRWTGARSG